MRHAAIAGASRADERVQYEQDRPGSDTLWAKSWHGGEALGPTMHVHPGIEVGVVLTGTEDIYHSELRVPCGPGQAWLCNMWEPHASVVPVVNEAVVLVFVPEFIGDEMLGDTPWLTLFMVPPGQRVRVTSPAGRCRVHEIACAMRREIEAQKPWWRAVVRAQLLELFVELLRAWGEESLPGPSTHAGPTDLARVMPAVSLVHSVPWRHVNVGEAAAACGLSPSRFHEVFKRVTGVTFGAFCLRARLSFAANRLIHTDRPVSSIAAEAGFVDDSHFRRRFSGLYQCSPADYRQRARRSRAKPA